MTLIERMRELNPEALYPTGFESCVVGIAERCGQPAIFVMDEQLCIQHLTHQGMSWEEAEEFYEFNVKGAWMGPHTPVFAVMDTDKCSS